MKEDDISSRVHKMFLHYILDVGLGTYIKQKIDEASSGVSISDIYQEVRLVLLKNNIPIHWLETIISIIKQEKYLMPDHEYLAIKVGEVYVFSQNFNHEKIREKRGEALTIEVNGSVSKTELKKFVNRHKQLISVISELLQLPKAKYFKGNSYEENLLAVLGQEQGLSISEIAKFANPNSPDAGDFSTTKKKISRGKKQGTCCSS